MNRLTLAAGRHHVVPVYLGGTDDPSNLVWLCPTTHTNVHELLRLMMTAGLLTYGECQAVQDRPVSRYAHRVATQGYLAWRARAVP